MSIQQIQRRDPAFDQTSFLARAEAVHSLVQRARSEGRASLARPGVGDDMAARLAADLQQLATAHRTEVNDARITSSSIVDAQADPSHDTIAVRFTLEGVSYVAMNGKPVAGDTDHRRTWAEDWWFQRPAGTTTDVATAVDLEHCLGCGAPANPTPDGHCAYCGRPLADPRTWVLVRTAEASIAAQGQALADLLGEQLGAKPAPTSGVQKIIVGIVAAVILGSVLVGIIAAVGGVLAAKNASDSVTKTINGISVPSVSVPDTTPGYLTPVANPHIHAPVNDLAAAAAALKAAVNRPVMLTAIHLYDDGRIMFEVQAPDDPASTDTYTWRRGKLEPSVQGSSHNSPDRFFPLEGLKLDNLQQICATALGKTGIADGVIIHPYLIGLPGVPGLKGVKGLPPAAAALAQGGARWYIPVQSESRAGNTKTYRVSLDGTKEDVF